MEYTFIGYGTNAGKFTDKSNGRLVEYCTEVVVVQGSDTETGFKQIKNFKLAKGFKKGNIQLGQRLTFSFDEWGKVMAICVR